MPEHVSDSERIEFALKTERDGHAFYQMATKQTGHKLANAAFKLLSKEELRHVDMIEALKKSIGQGATLEESESPGRGDLEFSLKTIYEGATEEQGEGEMDAAEAYEKAIELEKKITALYSGYATECEDEGARRLFASLTREEQNHLSLLEDMHAYLTKPDEWFIDRDGIMLDGG